MNSNESATATAGTNQAKKPALRARQKTKRGKVTAAASELQEERSRTNGFFGVIERWARRAADLRIAALTGAIAGTFTLSVFNLSSNWAPALGAHEFPLTMAAWATLAGAYLGYGPKNIRSFRKLEAAVREEETRKKAQEVIINSSTDTIQKVGSLVDNGYLTKTQGEDFFQQVLDVTVQEMRNANSALGAIPSPEVRKRLVPPVRQEVPAAAPAAANASTA